MPLDTTRRTVLKVIASTAVVTAVPVYLSGCSNVDINAAAGLMFEELEHPERAREIGEMYIAQSPNLHSITLEEISQSILDKLTLEISRKDLATLSTRLREQVHQDFIDEEVVIVDGWMLSKTEAMLCAVAALHPDSVIR